jgi:hypothetical protein
VSDIDAAVVDSLKVLDPNRPIREADIAMQNPMQNPMSALPSKADIHGSAFPCGAKIYFSVQNNPFLGSALGGRLLRDRAIRPAVTATI